MNYSVLMSVYTKEKVEYFAEAINSVLNQTVIPEQIVLVRDGIVYEELQNTIDNFVRDYPNLFTYLPLEQNGGLGNALRYGLEHCRNELVGRMDTDDLATPDRFEKQIRFFMDNPEIDVLGGQIEEFISEIDQVTGKRNVPCTHKKISKFIKTRCPFNHMTVMFKRQAVLEVGSYMDLHFLEDYYLWCRLFISGFKFANLPEVLVHARVDVNTHKRRGGIKYYKSFKVLEKYKYKNKVINWFQFVKNICIRYLQAISPNWLRGCIYKKVLREQKKTKREI